MSDNETLKVYANKAEDYAALVQSSLSSDPLLAEFIQALPKHASVLDLGCGPGTAAHVMAEAGLNVTATDAVAEMVALAAKHPSVTAYQASFDEIQGDRIFDGIWANFSLLHSARSDMPKHLTSLHTALKPSGLLHIGLKTGQGSSRDTIGRLYTYYTEDELSGLLEEAGFTLTHRTKGRDKGMDGTMADWIVVRAHA